MAFLGPSLRRKKVADRPAARVATAAAISLALNAAFIALLVRAGAFAPLRLGRTEQVALQPLSVDQWNANRAIAGSPAAAPRPPPTVRPQPTPAVKPPPPEDEPKGQVVDVAPSGDSRTPDKARFLSDRDNRVEKETRSRWAGAEVFKNRAPAPVHGGQQGEQQSRKLGDGGKDQETRQAKAGQGGTGGHAGKQAPRKEAPARDRSPAAPDERLALLEPPQKPGLLEPRPPAPGDESAAPGEQGPGTPGVPGAQQDGRRKLGDPRLLPSVPSMSRITAGPSSDYIDRDVEEGDATALNTKGFKFATFWNRFKQDVVGHWRPAIVYNERDPNGALFGSRSERATTLHVVLDASGSVKDITVVEPSGLDFLDREALRAVRAASPFYNVPAGLLDDKGEVSFSFGMVLVMDHPVPIRPRYQPGLP